MPNRTHQIECIVFRRNGDTFEYVLLKRAEERGGYWQPITGGVNPGEPDLAAVSREMQEEIAVVDPIRIVDLQYQFQFPLGDGRMMDEHVFCAELQPNAGITLSHEHTEYQWMTYEQALEMLKWQNNKNALEHCHGLIAG